MLYFWLYQVVSSYPDAQIYVSSPDLSSEPQMQTHSLLNTSLILMINKHPNLKLNAPNQASNDLSSPISFLTSLNGNRLLPVGVILLLTFRIQSSNKSY